MPFSWGSGDAGINLIVVIDYDNPSCYPRLLSPKGLPQLRRIAPELLGKKLKGKGHEHKDAARILRFYQLWADDLYPKANFRDTMSIIEKLGHTKRVQVTRNQFLDEYRQQIVSPEDEMETKDVQQVEKAKATGSGGRGDDDDDDDDEDLYEPPPVPVTSSMTQEINNGGSLFLGGDDSENEEVGAQPDDSELEMLLHGETTEGTEPTAKGKEISSAVDEMFNDDDLEAMDDWDELMDRSNTGRKSNEVESSELQSHESRLGTAFKASIFGGGGMGHEQPGGASTAPHDDPDDEDALEAMYGF